MPATGRLGGTCVGTSSQFRTGGSLKGDSDQCVWPAHHHTRSLTERPASQGIVERSAKARPPTAESAKGRGRGSAVMGKVSRLGAMDHQPRT